MKDVIELFQAARRVSTPLIAISTSDQFALARRLFQAVGNGDSPVPKLTHDIMRGLQPVNVAAKDMLSALDESEVMGTVNPPGMLALAHKFPGRPPEASVEVEGTLVVMYNAHRFVDDAVVAQGIANLRDAYCEDRRTLVLLGPSFQLPAELKDVVLLDEALPDDEQLCGVLARTYENAYCQIKDKRDVYPEWIDAVRGLSAFAAEQVFAMSLTKEGVDLDDLWERKRAAINQTRGLKFVRGGPSFDTLGGLDTFKGFMNKLGKKPGVIVFMDEIDKGLAGAQGDTTGVSQDFHGTLLSWMEDNFHDGMIAVGPPGSGKTAGGMAIGSTLDIPTIVLDLGGMKGSLVGESERSIRDALKVVDSVAGKDGAFVFATCNSERQLAPEFKRRFRSGMFFFDLPTAEERDVIWQIHLANYNLLSAEKYGSVPTDEHWTGAEIRNCFTPNHRLLGSDLRWREAGNFSKGDFVLGFDETGPWRQYRSATILRIDYAHLQTIRVELESGRRFDVTPEHRFLCRSTGKQSHWKRTDELQRNFSLPKLLPTWTDEATYEAGWLAGMFDGEGCFDIKRRELTLGQNPGSALDLAKNALSRRGFEFAERAAYGKEAAARGRRCKKLQVIGGLPEIYRLLGSIRPRRLLEKVNFDALGRMESRLGLDRIVAIEPAGEKEIIKITTTTSTLVVDGYPHHNCCDLASRMDCSLDEASQYVVPIAKANARGIDALRDAAHGKWLSASYPGPYRGVEESSSMMKDHKTYRKVELAG